tara:strand:+ start:2637 stop:5027 length:2391 start_codon:yes stop_codon:yes gene_type:complete
MQVPLQTAPSVQLTAGSGVQLPAGPAVKPQEDVVSDDILRFGKAYQNFGVVLNKLDDERNDAEAKQLANEYYTEVASIKGQYSTLKGVDAVGTVEANGEKISIYDQYNNKLKETLETYQKKASNGTVQYIFDNKAAVYTRAAQTDMTNHSLVQQRKYLEEETDATVVNSQSRALDAYATFQDPTGPFNINRLEGLASITESAKLKGWNVDPDLEIDGPDGKKIKIGVSERYIKAVNDYNIGLAKGVLKRLTEDKNQAGVKSFLAMIKPEVDAVTYKKIEGDTETKHNEHNSDKKIDAVLTNNADQNNGNALDQAKLLMGLSSNQSFEDGKGDSVTDGFHSNDVDTTNTKQSENIETLLKLKSTSKFYQPDSNLRLIPQHQTTHLFAIQHLGVKAADSLYTKAKNSVGIDPQRFKDDPKYAKEMNAKILDKYNELIVGSANRRFFLFDGTYVNKIDNDLQVIKQGVNYDFDPSSESTIEVDEVTDLQPVEVLKNKLKATTKDPTQLKYELENLEIAYNKIKAEKEALYNRALEKAKEIALVEKGGWRKLAENGIEIDMFTEADQAMLKKGPPEESNIETLAKLDANPDQVRNNLPAYRDQISTTQYSSLERYAASLQSESKYIEATGDNTLFKDTLYKNGFQWVYGELKGKNAATFHSIKTAWINRIDYVQTHVEGRKLTREEKKRLLNNVLLDNIRTGWGLRDIPISSFSINPDKLENTFVNVNVKQENGTFKNERIFGSKIKPLVQSEIKAFLFRNKLAMSQQRIAEIWVKFGRPTSVEQFKKKVEAATLSLRTR